MAAIGKAGVHKVIGYFCDLCGKECEGDKEELNALGTFKKKDAQCSHKETMICVNSSQAISASLGCRVHVSNLR